MADVHYSRPIRLTSSGNNLEVYGSATKVTAITLSPKNGDVVAQFTDGPGGQIVWEMEADDSSGSNSVSFGRYPLLFKTSVYVNIIEDNVGQSLRSLNVAVVLPASAGT
jgi:hypothetical protein